MTTECSLISVSIPPSPLKLRTFGQVHSTRHEFPLVEKTSTLIQVVGYPHNCHATILTGACLPWYVSIIAYRWAIPLKYSSVGFTPVLAYRVPSGTMKAS